MLDLEKFSYQFTSRVCFQRRQLPSSCWALVFLLWPWTSTYDLWPWLSNLTWRVLRRTRHAKSV